MFFEIQKKKKKSWKPVTLFGIVEQLNAREWAESLRELLPQM